jgi:ABC-2 type transport system permease protein
MKPQRIIAVMVKELRELARDPVTIWASLLMPLTLLMLFGYAISLDVKNISMGVWDLDRTPRSRALVDAFLQSGYFNLHGVYRQAAEMDAALQRGEIKLAMVIPARFHAALERHDTATVQLLVDGTFSNTAQIVANYADAIVAQFHVPDARPVTAVRPEIRVWYNAQMRSVNYIVPGLFAVILLAFPPLLTTLGIVREKESGSIQQIFASPLTGPEFLLGKLLPYGLIAFLQILLVSVFGIAWFDVPMRGSWWLLLGAGLIYVLCTVGIGLLVSTLARKQVVAMLLALVVTLMPSFLYSGFLFPIFTMPVHSQWYASAFPGRYYVDIARAVVMKGAELGDIWRNMVWLLLYTAVVFALATWRFRKKVA